MTREEMIVSGLVGEFKVDERPLREIGYAVFELKPSTAEVYVLKLQLVSEISESIFPFPATEFRDSVLSRRLPEGLRSSLTEHFDSPIAKLIRSRAA